MESIKSFTVDIGYNIDEGSIRRAEQGFEQTGVSVDNLQAGVNQLIKALQAVAKQLSETGGKPARDIQNTGTQIKNTWEMLRKGAKEWGTTAALTTGAFVKSMQEVAKQYTELYYLSSRSGVSVQALKAMENASKELGGSAGEATSVIANLHEQFQKYPGVQTQFREKTAAYADDVRKNMGLNQDQFKQLDQGVKDYATAVRALANMKPAEAEVWGKAWGFASYADIQKAVTQMDEYEKSIGRNIATMDAFGLTRDKQEDIAKRAVALQGDWNRLMTDFGAIWTQSFDKVEPYLKMALEFVDKIVVDLGKFNKDHPWFAVGETFIAMGAASAGILALLNKFTGGNLFGGILGQSKDLKDKFGGIESALKSACDEKCGGLKGTLDELKEKGGALSMVFDGIGIALKAWAAFEFGYQIGKQLDAIIEKSERGREVMSKLGDAVSRLVVGKPEEAAAAAVPIPENIARRIDERKREQAIAQAPPGTEPPPIEPTQARASWGYEVTHGDPLGRLTEKRATSEYPEWRRKLIEQAGTLAGASGYQEGGIVPANLHQGEMVLPKNISEGVQKLFARGGQAEKTERAMNRIAGLAMTVAQKLAPAAMSPVFGQANATLRLIQILEKGIAEAREDPKGLANPERGQALWDKYTGGSRVGEFPGMFGGGQDREGKDADRRLGNWLIGVGSAPKVIFENVEQFAEQFAQALLRKQGAGATGEGGGGAGAGGAGGGGPAGAGAPAGAGGAGAPMTPGGRAGAAVGEALSKLIGGEGAGGGVMRDQRLDLLEKTIYQLETSSGTNVTTSAAGARGHMQMMPATFREFAKPGENIDDPEDNKRVARRYIEHLYDRFGGDMDKVLTAYNAGPARVGKPVGDLPTETQNYLAKAHKMWGGRVPTEPMTGGPVSPGFGPGAYGEKGGGKVNAAAGGGADPDLVAATTAGFNSVLPEGYTAKISSGMRKGDPRFHGKGMAVDFQIYGPDGKEIPNRGSDSSGLYHKGYVASMAYMMNTNPEKAKDMGWGGHFPIPGTNTPDIMHIDLGTQRGRYANEKVFAQERQEAAAQAKQIRSQQIMTAQMGGIIPNIMGGIMPLLAHAGEMILPKELSQGLQRMIAGGDAIAGIERMGALAGGAGANRPNNNVTFNQTNNTNIASAMTGGSQAATASRFRDAHERIYGDLVRNFRAVLA